LTVDQTSGVESNARSKYGLSSPGREGKQAIRVSRVYGDPIEVWTSDGRPARFVWRGRLYTVLRVLDHWVITRDWLREADDEPAHRVFWRVEAMPDGTAGVYELRHDAATGTWMLSRAWE
jgi:hypothetical protein